MPAAGREEHRGCEKRHQQEGRACGHSRMFTGTRVASATNDAGDRHGAPWLLAFAWVAGRSTALITHGTYGDFIP